MNFPSYLDWKDRITIQVCFWIFPLFSSSFLLDFVFTLLLRYRLFAYSYENFTSHSFEPKNTSNLNVISLCDFPLCVLVLLKNYLPLNFTFAKNIFEKKKQVASRKTLWRTQKKAKAKLQREKLIEEFSLKTFHQFSNSCKKEEKKTISKEFSDMWSSHKTYSKVDSLKIISYIIT